MSSVKYNIKRKMEWMGRRLRYIDGAGEIKEWATAMSALNVVLKEIDIKGSADNWRPWKKSKEVVREDLRTTGSQSWEGTLASKKVMGTEMIERRNKPFLAKIRAPRVEVDGEDDEMFDPKAAVMEMLKIPQKERWSESLDLNGKEIIRGGVVKTNMSGGGEVLKKDFTEKKRTVKEPTPKEETGIDRLEWDGEASDQTTNENVELNDGEIISEASTEEVIMSGAVGKVGDKIVVKEETKRWMGAIKRRIDAVESSESLKWLTQDGRETLIQGVEHDLNVKFKSTPRDYRSQLRSNLWRGTKKYWRKKESLDLIAEIREIQRDNGEMPQT